MTEKLLKVDEVGKFLNLNRLACMNYAEKKDCRLFWLAKGSIGLVRQRYKIGSNAAEIRSNKTKLKNNARHCSNQAFLFGFAR